MTQVSCGSKRYRAKNVVVLSIDGGPELTLHPETARDLLLAQAGQASRGADTARGSDEVLVPSTLRWPGPDAAIAATRAGFGELVGGIVLKAVDIVTGVARDKAAELAAGVLARRVDAQVNPGVYRLNARSLDSLKDAARLERVDPPSGNVPLLVFVHGTFSNTSSAFQTLWRENPGRVRSIFDRYQDAVYGLDHPTLGASPIANAITLAEALPADATLHLVTHSRGGLVAEVLAQVCARPTVSAAELTGFLPDQRNELNTLAALVSGKRIQVGRIVRVACPARGTLLASKRLDAYLSVFRWTLQLAGVPVLPELVDFLGAVAQHRLDAETLPGLEAQVPDSPLIRWLHAGTEPIPGELRVVAGDVEGDSVTSWVKTLLSDGFYWTDNDFVVQTRSMYGGARRRAGATFLLDQGGKVSHSAYFARSRAAEKVVEAILQDQPSDFRVVGPLSWKGEDSSGLRAALAGTSAPPSDKPAVFVIPGLAGSRLTTTGGLIWPASLSNSALEQLKYSTDGRNAVASAGLVGNTFDDVIATLSLTHDVIPFPYDWRQPLEVEAERLADAIDAATDARRSSGRPVRILAHSSGGVLARVVQLVRPAAWERFMSVTGARIVMLGTPNGGFWTPMQILTGDETFGGLLTAAAPPFGEADVRTVMGTFPGLLQLQAGLLDPASRLGERARWQHLAESDAAAEQATHAWHTLPLQRKAYLWGLPTEDALERAVALRRGLDTQARDILPGYRGRLAIVFGTAAATPDGFASHAGRFVYLDFPQHGDGRVAVHSALLPGIDAWAVECDHAALPGYKDAFAGYLELLEHGTTDKLPAAAVSRSSVRAAEGAPSPIPNRPSRGMADRLPEDEKEILATRSRGQRRRRTVSGKALHVRVINGDLMFVRQPLVLGHYRSMRLTGSELAMDSLTGQTMSRSLGIGFYPEVPGANQIFMNAHVRGDDRMRVPRPESVVVVGLGEEGKLNASALARTVRQGVVAWAQRAAEKPGAPVVFELAATLIGSGGKGMTVAQSAQLVTEAVREADALLEGASLPRVAELQIIELYLDRATEAWRALQLLAHAAPDHYIVADTISTGNGALRRPLDSSYRGAAYDFISAAAQQGADGRRSLVYALDTKRARTEVTAQATQAPLLTELLNASNMLTARSDVGRTLFNMLVPAEIEAFLGGSTELVIELDGGTAGIPWELLDTNTNARQEDEPWAIRSKLVRKLRTVDHRARTTDATADDRVLVVGEPRCDPKRYSRLPGARREANAVFERLRGGLDASRVLRVISPDEEQLPGPSSVAVLSALYMHPWRIVHIAGHGEPSSRERLGGVVLSPSGPDNVETFLSAIEIQAMRVVPELVFVNCCHIAARERLQLLEPESPLRHHYDRPAFAAGLAEELIKIGVRCVVAAGWAVDDIAAQEFATTFYDALLAGSRFIDAVAEARKAAWRLGGTTWAAYQCYGDPEWTFVRHVADAQQPPVGIDWPRRLADVASPQSLMLALDTIAIEARFHKKPDREEHERLKDLRDGIGQLEQKFGGLWGHIGYVADGFGTARAEIGDLQKAVEWYDRAVSAADGTASLRAAEQAANLRARIAWQQVSHLAGAADPSPDVLVQLRKAAADIEAAIRPLETLCELRSTMERESLIGAAYKRIALVWGAARARQEERSAIEKMRNHYVLADAIARDQQDADVFYPALNRLVADVALSAGDPNWDGLDGAAVEAVRQALAAKLRDDPDFWSAVGVIELRMFEALAGRSLAAVRRDLAAEFEALGQRVPAARMWSSVYDNATFVLRLYMQRARDQAHAASGRHAETWSAEVESADALLALLRRLSGTRDRSSTAGKSDSVGR